MSTYVYTDKAKKFEIYIVELRGCVRVTLTDKGVTTQLCTAKSLEAAFKEVETLFSTAGKPAPRPDEWKQL